MTDPFLERGAEISECGTYRYLLRRIWDYEKPRALAGMLNPSTADAEQDDATIRALYRLLAALGFGGFEVVNLFAFRATNPAELEKADDPVGPNADAVISAAVNRCDLPIVAWGAHPMAAERQHKAFSLLTARRPAVFCFGKTKDGSPKHPLYLRTGTQLEAWRP